MQSKHLLVALLCLPLLGGGIFFLTQEEAPGVDYGRSDEGGFDPTTHGPSGTLTGNTHADPADAGERVERTELGSREVAKGRGAPIPRPPVVIHGRVVNKFGAGLGGARITLTLRRPGGRGRPGQGRIKDPVVTKQDGSFEYQGQGFPDLQVELEITHEEHALTLYEDTFRGLDTDGDIDVGEVEVVVGGSLSGAITDMAGVVLPGAEARLLPQDGRFRNLPNRREVFPAVEANNSGFFRIEHIPPGQYRVVGVAPHRQRRYTDVVTVPDAEEVVLDPIQLGPGFELTGRIFKPEGGPVPKAEVSLLFSQGWGGAQRDRTDKEGQFSFDHLAAGTYSLKVRAKGYLQYQQHSIQVDRAPELNITLANGLRVSGIVLDAVTNQPVTSYAVRVRRVGGFTDPNVQKMRALHADLQRAYEAKRRKMNGKQRRQMEQKLRQVRMQLRENGDTADWRRQQQRNRGRDPRQDLPSDAGKPEPRPAGKFSFDGLEEGVYVVDFSAPAHQRVRSEQIELRSGGVTPYLALYMERGLLLAGSILDKQGGEPIPNARVDLMVVQDQTQPPGGNGRPNPWQEVRKRFEGPGQSRGMMFLNTRTDKNGKFRLQQAGPGTYQLIARADGHSRGFTEPFDLTADVDDQKLLLGRLGVIHGRVYNVPPDKVDKARVVVSDLRRNKTVKIEPDMTYRVEDLQPGSYMVRAFVGNLDVYRRSSMRRFREMGGNLAQIKPDVQIEEGSDVEFDTRIDQDPVGDFKGQLLVNGFGSGAKGFRIHLQEINPMGLAAPPGLGPGRWRPNRASARVDQKGNYRLGDVMAGRYTMSILAPGSGAPEVHRQVVYVHEDQDNTQAPISLTLGSITGNVLPEGTSFDNLEAGQRLWGNVQLLPGITEMPKDWREFRRNNPVYGQQVRRGKFKFENLPVGDYLMVLRANGFAPRVQPVFVDGSPMPQEYRTGKRRRPNNNKPAKPKGAAKGAAKGANAKKPQGSKAKGAAKPKGNQGR